MDDEKILQFSLRAAVTLIFSFAIIIFLYTGSIIRFLRKEKSINLLAWGAILDKEFMEDFEKTHGIKVNIIAC